MSYSITIRGKSVEVLKKKAALFAQNNGEQVVDAAPVHVADEVQETELESTPLTLEEDVLPAMQSFAKRNGLPAAKAILAEFGVKHTKDLQPEDFEAVMDKIS